MWTKRNCIILAVMLLWSISSYSQESRSEVFVDFRINSIRIDQAYGNNAERLREITDILQGVLNDPAVEIIQLSFCGTASPEGSYQLNKNWRKGVWKPLKNGAGKSGSAGQHHHTRQRIYPMGVSCQNGGRIGYVP